MQIFYLIVLPACFHACSAVKEESVAYLSLGINIEILFYELDFFPTDWSNVAFYKGLSKHPNTGSL